MSRTKYPLLICLVLISLHAHFAHAGVSDWQKGFTVMPQSSTDFSSSSFDQSLRNMKSTGANYVTLGIPYSQKTVSDTKMFPAVTTPTDDSLVSAINFAHTLDLAVNLNIHLETNDTKWRAYINPADRTAWFKSYGLLIGHYAALAQQNHVEMLTLGAELIDMTSDNVNSTNTSNWINLINNARAVYSGLITYDGNWGGGTWNDELDHIKFWSNLDYIGVSAYYHIGGSSPNGYTAASLASVWSNVDQNQLGILHNQYGKQVLFTEVGYRSVDGALVHPADWQLTAPVDEQEQSDGYQSLFDYWSKVPYFSGVQFWNWSSNPGAGGPTDTDFIPQGKLAETTITNWFTNNSNSEATDLGELAWVSATNGWGPVEKNMSNGEQAAGDGHPLTINGNIYSKGFGVNSISKIEYKIANCSRFTSDIGIDDEVTSRGSVNFQIWSANSLLYDSGLMTWADPAKTIKLDLTGVSDLILVVTDGGNGTGHDHADWANPKITCANTAPSITPAPAPVPPPTPTPPPPPAQNAILDLWWPTDGSIISGTTPFKALLEGFGLDQYYMYWQVDGDVLNPMTDSSVDWPHKEAVVDVSGWSWRGSGPYVLTFTAKDFAGNILAQKTVTISVAN